VWGSQFASNPAGSSLIPALNESSAALSAGKHCTVDASAAWICKYDARIKPKITRNPKLNPDNFPIFEQIFVNLNQSFLQ
jgi:hypothetical protein